jgi:hypothetical protein
MSIVSLKMSDELMTRLAAAARSRGISRSALVRDALESFLGGGGVGDGSAADLAVDLIGSLKAPRDLSHHPRYMEGFGR